MIIRPSIAVAMAVIAAVLGGYYLLSLREPDRRPRFSPEANVGLASAVGLSVWLLVLFFLAVTGQLSRFGCAAATAVIGLLGWPTRRQLWSDLRALARSCRPQCLTELGLAGWCGAILVLCWIAALAPPRDPDGLAYHLPLARRFAQQEKLVHVSALESYTAAYPLGVEVAFAAVYQLGGETAPACLEFACGLLLLLVVAAEGSRLGDRRAGLIAAAAVLASPVVILLLSTTYVDLFFILLAVSSLALVNRGEFVLAGLLAGVSIGTKPGFGVLPAVIGLCVVALSWSGFGAVVEAERRGALARFTLTTVVAAIHWPLWRWWTTGNPIYPLVWGGNDIAPAAVVRLHHLMRLSRYDLVDLIAGRVQVRDVVDLMYSNGPLLLALVPIVILSSSLWRRHTALLVATTISLGMVACLYARDRFLLLPLAYLAPLVGVVWSRLVDSGVWVRRATWVLTVVGLGWGLIWTMKHQLTFVPYVVGRESRHAYLQRWFRDYPLADATNNAVLPAQGVLQLCRLDCREYYATYRALTSQTLVLEQGRIATTASAIEALMRSRNLTHVIDCGNLSELFSSPSESEEFTNRLELVFDDGGRKRLLRLRRRSTTNPRPSPSPPSMRAPARYSEQWMRNDATRTAISCTWRLWISGTDPPTIEGQPV